MFFIVLLSLIILTCDSGGEGDTGASGNDSPEDDGYENEVSLTFSGDLSNFNEDLLCEK